MHRQGVRHRVLRFRQRRRPGSAARYVGAQGKLDAQVQNHARRAGQFIEYRPSSRPSSLFCALLQVRNVLRLKLLVDCHLIIHGQASDVSVRILGIDRFW